MSREGRIGKPVIDELRICYIADPLLLDDLSHVEVGKFREFAPFTVYRVSGDRFEYTFSICIGDVEAREEVGLFKYGRYGAEDSTFCYLKVVNSVLYDQRRLKQVLSFPTLLGLVFNNFTAIDIAIDHSKNVSSIIKRMMRNPEVDTILNGKKIQDRRKRIPGVTIDYSTSLNRLKCPTITIRQAKAIKNKENGITVQSYDKKAEVEGSEKEYILDYYNDPRYLFRLEVRLHYQELQDYCKKNNVIQCEEMLFDQETLMDMYYYHLSSVLRFSKGRVKLAWQDIISCSGRV